MKEVQKECGSLLKGGGRCSHSIYRFHYSSAGEDECELNIGVGWTRVCMDGEGEDLGIGRGGPRAIAYQNLNAYSPLSTPAFIQSQLSGHSQRNQFPFS